MLKELKNEDIFPRQSNIVTIQCSGTRRIEQISLYPGDGDELINAPVSGPPLPLHVAFRQLIGVSSGQRAQSGPQSGPESA